MASPALVIVSGSAVTTWNSLKEDKPFSFYPHGDLPISDATWNHNGQVLASCSAVSTDEKLHHTVVLTAAQTGNRLDSLQHNQQWKREAGAATSLAFGGKSRYLCIGDKSGAVCLWDLKKRLRVRQFFHDNNPSLQVSLDPTDTYVMSLSQRLFSIYNLREGTQVGSFEPPGNYSFTKFDTSSLEPHLSLVGTSDGSILLFDITNHSQASPLWSLNRRQSRQITGVAFSPTNPNLFGSTSADGSLMFYDKNSGETIQQLASLSSGIQSLTMHSDGFSCAVGTEAGEVLMYDLRQNMPLSSLYVQGPVKSLQFAPPPKDKQSHQNSSVQKSIIGSSNDQNQLMILKRDLDRATGQASTDFSHSGQKSVSSQRTSGHQSETCDGGNQSYAGPPLRANQSFSHNSLEPRHEPAAYGSNQNYSNPTTPQRAAQQPESSTQANGVGYSGQPPTKSPPQRSLGKPQLSPISTKPTTPPGDREEQKKHQPISQQQEDVSSYTSSLPPRYTEEKKVQEKPKVNLEEVREVVRDEVESLRDDMEEAIRNLHMDMISQFHQQSQELSNALTAQLATIDRLTSENQFLREENERLRGFSKSGK